MGNERQPRDKDSVVDLPVASSLCAPHDDALINERCAPPAVQSRSATDLVAWDEV
jgi:hypothetical protein